MPRGHSLSIFALFSGKRRTSLYISRAKGDHLLNSNTAQRSCNLFLGKHKEELPEKRALILSKDRVTCFGRNSFIIYFLCVFEFIYTFLLFGSSCTCVFKEKSLR